MELDRFHEARWYHGRTPLKELSFAVHVWRAPVQDENNRELVCKHRVTWNDKIQAPHEKIAAIKQFLAFQAQQTAALRQGEASSPPLAVEELLQQIRQLPGATCAEQLNSFCATGTNMFFTHPTAADFINLDEERSPVEPEQPVTPLTQAVLRRHQREHQPSKTMYLMLSVGGVFVAPGADANNPQNARWAGRDLVICCLTSTEDDTAFIAKPCLHETHTLLVDGRTIWTFLVEAIEGAVAAPTPSLARPEIGAAIRRVGSSVTDHAVFASRDESERRTFLRQVISRRRVASATATSDLQNEDSFRGLLSRHHAEKVPRAPFTAEPPFGLARFHFLGNIKQCIGVAAGSVRIKLTVVLPDGCRADTDGNAKAGVTHQTDLVSQLAYAALINDWKSCAPEVMHVFNMPFEVHCVQSPVTAAPVRLAATLVSLGPGGDSVESTVGYGCITLCNLPGSHKLEIPLWRPKPTGREFLKSIFVGGSPSLVEISDIIHQPMQAGVGAKTGLHVESVGVLKVECMTIAQVWSETGTDRATGVALSRRLSRTNLAPPTAAL
jgi:hypothetical protein